MTQVDGKRTTTDELLAQLARLGLRVTRDMLAQDVKAGYLPPLQLDPRGPRQGIGRFWEPWAVRRAVYLYRLRQGGIQGDLLRVLLFLRDGWGWERVRPIAIKGLRKLTGMQVGPVRQRFRHPTPKNVEFELGEIAAELATNPQTLGFILGQGLFGRPLAGGSLRHLAGVLASFGVTGDRAPDGAAMSEELDRAEQILAASETSWDQMAELAERADADLANDARQVIIAELRRWRAWLQRYYHQHQVKGWSANPLTMGGQSRREIAGVFRLLPGRPTPAQCLAGFLVPFLWLAEQQRRGVLPPLGSTTTEGSFKDSRNSVC